MYGITDFVIVIVVNNLDDSSKKPTNGFDRYDTVRIAALRSIYADTIGNQHNRSDIQKQAYPASSVQTVRQAYGITGTNYDTHVAYRNGKLLALDDEVINYDEITLIHNDLNTNVAFRTAQVHRILPERKGS